MSDLPRRSETYWDIVWRQFRKHTPAVVSLWSLSPLLLVAIFAPLLASNQPLVFFDSDGVKFPWLRSLFVPEQAVDFVFNMGLLAFVPCAVACGFLAWRWRRQEVPLRRQIFWGSLLYLAATFTLVALFSPLPGPAIRAGLVPEFRPTDKYKQATFTQIEFAAAQRAAENEGPAVRGVYAPVAFGPTEQDLDSRYQRPLYAKDRALARDSNDHHTHWLGTDDTGRDVLVEMIYGTRIAITVGFAAVAVYVTIGIFLGVLAGYLGGWADMVISRLIEIVIVFPSFFLILTLVALLGRSIYIVMFAIAITSWTGVARLVRGEVLKQRAIDYVQAARALGASHVRIMFRHVLPNALSPVLVAVPFGISSSIITEAGLSLLGFGVRPPATTWGSLLNQVSTGSYGNWWLIVFPSLAMFLVVTLFNLVGSGLRDAMDPKLRR